MKNVNQLLKNQDRPLSDSVPSDLPSKAVMDRLWEVMLEIYGHKWESNYGTEPLDSWARSLRGISPKQIAKGFDALNQSGEGWPPSALEFAKMCRGGEITGSWGTAAHRIFDKSKLLPEGTEEGRQKAGKEALTDMKGMFA